MVANENETIVVETVDLKPWSEFEKELEEAMRQDKRTQTKDVMQEIAKTIVLAVIIALASLGVLTLWVHYASLVLENVRTVGVIGVLDSMIIASVGVLMIWSFYSVYLMMKWYKEQV